MLLYVVIMVLIFAHHYDQEAKWLSHQLPLHGNGITVKLIIAEALGIDYTLSLSIENNSSNASILFNNDTRPIKCGEVSFVINRLTFIDPIIWNKSDKKEKDYAMNEINAFFAALIYSFNCPAVNPVEHGSLLGNNSGTYPLIKTLIQRGIAIHPFAMEENENSFRLMETNAATCLRVICWRDKIFFPPHQITVEFNDRLTETLSRQYMTAITELFFIYDNARFELLYISKSAALSLYGQPFLQYLSHAINKPQPCF